jgi:hypothetical protein
MSKLPSPAPRVWFAIFASATIAAAAAPVSGQGGQVSPAAYVNIMKSQSAGIRTYKGAASEKALAACIDWSQSKGDRVAWRELGYQYGRRTVAVARSEALQYCLRNARQKNIQGCSCHIIDVNGQYAN